MNNRFQAEKSLCHRSLFFASVELSLASFPFTYTMYIPQHMSFFQNSYVNQGKDFSFASVDASTLALYIFHVYLVVNPKTTVTAILNSNSLFWFTTNYT